MVTPKQEERPTARPGAEGGASCSSGTFMPVTIHRLTPDDVGLMHALLSTFGEAFADRATYVENRSGTDYLKRLLGGDTFIALAAMKGDELVGGIAAYELKK